MNQEAISQIPVNQEQFNELTEMPEDPFISTRIPITDLAVCPELIEALPSIEDDFFRTPLSEEE
ncbi:hypothetical protein AYI69_g8036, partial [Smittium culicis]